MSKEAVVRLCVLAGQCASTKTAAIHTAFAEYRESSATVVGIP